jgi:hypothetical protein
LQFCHRGRVSGAVGIQSGVCHLKVQRARWKIGLKRKVDDASQRERAKRFRS